MHYRKLTAALGLLGATMLSAPLAAQDAPPANPTQPVIGVETVTVTARRRPENLEKVPVAVTAATGTDLREQNIKSAIDLQQISPSLTVSADLGSRDDNVFTIRGQSQPFGGADPGVQTYFNEVPFGASGPGNYYDLDNIQISRGPQGTYFGRNTTGGAVQFTPKRPTGDFGGYLDASTGSYSGREIQGAINLPISGDDFAIRAAGDFARRDGFTTDVTTHSDLDNVDYDAFRVGVVFRPASHVENYAVFDYLRDDNHGTGAELTSIDLNTLDNLATQYNGGVPCTNPPSTPICGALANFELGLQGALANQQALGPRRTTSSIPLFFKRNDWGITDIARWDVSDDFYVRNIFGFRHSQEQPAFDYDGSFLPLLDIPNPRTWESDSKQLTEEFQLVGNDAVFNWIVGYYFENDQPAGYSEVERDVFGGPYTPFGSTEVDSLSNGGTSNAVYGSATYDADSWLKGLSLTFGGRYTFDHKIAKSASCVQYAGDPACPYPVPSTMNPEYDHQHFSAPSWTVAANYQVTDDTMVYATFRRGYKSGGFNSGAVNTGYTEFKPEYLTDVELGTKNDWTILGVPGRTNFDVYYGWYHDIQKNDEVAFESYNPFVMPPLSAPRVVALTLNAARATIKGLEFESTFIPDENFQLTAYYSYTDATYDSFTLPQAIVYVVPTGQTMLSELDHKGDPFAYTPRNKLGLTARLHVPIDESMGQPYLSASWYWQSKVWFTDFADLEPHAFQSGYDLLNARFDWDNFLGSTVDFSVFLNNATDKTYKVGANALEHLTGTTSSIYGAPRMWGVELRYRFGDEDAQ